ncbi:MAG: type II toxin-antitoxin system HicA family toxin [Verrucomicrobia bacterium]|nr:type II toxin-antitoxin system HicA family toxin [Verrucomicrobiota bacterium]
MESTKVTNGTSKSVSSNNNATQPPNLVGSIFQQVQQAVPNADKALNLQAIPSSPKKLTVGLPKLSGKEEQLLQEMFTKWPLHGGPALIDLFGFALYESWEALLNFSPLSSLPKEQRELYLSLRDYFDMRFVLCYQSLLQSTRPGDLSSPSSKFFIKLKDFSEVICKSVKDQILEQKFIVHAVSADAQARMRHMMTNVWNPVKERAQKISDIIALLQKFLEKPTLLLSYTDSFPQNKPSTPVQDLQTAKAFCKYIDHYFKVGDEKASVTGFAAPMFLEIPAKVDSLLKSTTLSTWAPIDQWFFDKMKENGEHLHNLYYHLNKAKSDPKYTYRQFCEDTKIQINRDLTREEFLSSLFSRILARQTQCLYLSDIHAQFLRLIDSKENKDDFPRFDLHSTRLLLNFGLIQEFFSSQGVQKENGSGNSQDHHLGLLRLHIMAICFMVMGHLPDDLYILKQAYEIQKQTPAVSLTVSAFSLLKNSVSVLPTILEMITSMHKQLVVTLKEVKQKGLIKLEDRESLRKQLIDESLFLASFVMMLQDAKWLYVERNKTAKADGLPEELVDFLLLEEFDEIFQMDSAEELPEPTFIEEISEEEITAQLFTSVLPHPEAMQFEGSSTLSTESKRVSRATAEHLKHQERKKQGKMEATLAPSPTVTQSSKSELEPPSKREVTKATKRRKLEKILKKYGYDESESGVGSHTKIYNDEARDQIVEPRRLKKGLLNSFYKQLQGAWEKSQKKD